MDSIASNPELGQDLLQLLHRKLQQRRQELDDLQKASSTEAVLIDSRTMRAENEELRSELAQLELQMSTSTLRDQGSKAPSRELSPFDSREVELHRAIEDMRQRETIQGETIAELQERLDKYKEKYNASKSENAIRNETLVRVTEDLRSAIEVLDGLQKDISTAEMSLATVKKGPGSSNFDWKAFHNGPLIESPKGTPRDLKPFLSSATFSQLPEDMLKKYGKLKLLVLRSYECEWSPNGISRGLHILPSYVYDPTAYSGDGGWIRNHKGDQLHQNRCQTNWEVLYQRQNEWYYYGTYQREDELQDIHCPLARPACNTYSQVDKALALDTHVVRHKDQVSPVVLSFISALRDGGLLAFDRPERIGFNHSFNDSLRMHRKSLQQVSSKPKKKSQGSGDDGDPPKKKQKVKS